MTKLERYQSVFLSRDPYLNSYYPDLFESDFYDKYKAWAIDKYYKQYKLKFLLRLWRFDKHGGEYHYKRAKVYFNLYRKEMGYYVSI